MSTHDNIYDDDTRLDNSNLSEYGINADNGQKVAKEDYGVWKKVTISGITGMVLGAGATYVYTRGSEEKDDAGAEQTEETGTEETVASTETESTVAETHNDLSSLVDEEVPFATTVSEDMPFSQAFATAKAELGPGGVFQWHGNIYSTYTAEEWDNMNSSEKAEFNDHFAWNHGSDSAVEENVQQPTVEDNPINRPDMANDDSDHGEPTMPNDGVPEVEVLGVVYDYGSGTNIAGLTMDGQNVALVDIDGDGIFDIAASDLDHNGELSEDEIVDLSQGEDISVIDLLPDAQGGGADYTAGETPDDPIDDGDINSNVDDGSGMDVLV